MTSPKFLLCYWAHKEWILSQIRFAVFWRTERLLLVAYRMLLFPFVCVYANGLVSEFKCTSYKKQEKEKDYQLESI